MNMKRGEDLERALADPDPWQRADGVRGARLTREQLERALTDEQPQVRIAAIRSGGLADAQLERALTDQLPQVRAAAVRCGDIRLSQLARAMSDRHIWVRIAAMQRAVAARMPGALSFEQERLRRGDGRTDSALPRRACGGASSPAV